MPKYAVAVEGSQYEVDAPDEQTAWNWAVYTHQNQPKAQPPAPFSLADVGLTGAAGAVGATRAVLQAFGPEAPGVQTLGEFQQSLLGMRTPERQAEVARRAALEEQAAKSGKPLEEIGAFLGGIKEAPIQSIAQGIGSTVPALLTGAVTLVAGAPAAIAGAVTIGTRFLFGALQGAGEVKGSIYDNVFRELKEKGVPEVEAKRQAEAAQDYIGSNSDNIFVGAGLGALAGGTGAEAVLGNYVAKKVGVDLAKGAAKKEAEGLIMRGVKEALKEGIPEGLQGGQEQFASNVALAREGIETPEFQGVLGSAARDAVIGALTGAAVSPFGREKAEAPTPRMAAPEEKLTDDQLIALRDQYTEAETELNRLAEAAKVSTLTPEEKQAAVNAYIDYKNTTFAPLRALYVNNKRFIDALTPQPEAPVEPPTVEAPPPVEGAAPPVIEAPTPTAPPTTPVATGPSEPNVEPPRGVSPVTGEPKSAEPPAPPTEAVSALPTPPEKREFQIDTPREQIAQDVKGMTVPELARWAVVNAPNTPAREFALKAFDRINEYADRGIFPGKIDVKNGTRRLVKGRGVATHWAFPKEPQLGFDITIGLNGLNEQGTVDLRTGTQYSTILHELLHAATHIQLEFNPNSKPVKELNNLYKRVKAQVQVDINKGIKHPALDAIRSGSNTMLNVHELVSWGLTDKNFQDYLATIKVGEKTAFTKFVEIMRKLLNINPEFDTALDSFLRSSEALLSTPVKKIEKAAGFAIKPTGTKEKAVAPRIELPKPPAPPKAEEPPPKPPEAEEPPSKPSGIKVEPGKPFTRPKLPPLGPKPPELDISNVELSKKPPEQGGREPQVQAAAMLLAQGKMTREEYEKYVDYYRPIYPIDIDALLPPSTVPAMEKALGKLKNPNINRKIADGTRVGLRMDLPALDRGVPVVSIHEGLPNFKEDGEPYKKAGDVFSYTNAAYIKNVFFAPRDQDKSLRMGYMPKGKDPLQTAEGEWVNMTPAEIYRRVKALKDDPAWMQVGFDPHRHGYFYDRKTRKPVVAADEVFQVGNFVLAKNVKYAPKEEFLYETGPVAVEAEENVGAQAVDIINKIGMGVQPPQPGIVQQTKDNLKYAYENPKLTIESAKKATTGFLDRIETAAFSSSAAFDNQLRRAVAGDIKDNEVVIGMLIDASQSQAVHADALASQFIIEGGIRYDEEYKKWVAYKEPDNFVELGKQINEVAKKYNISEDEARRVTHAYFISKRLKSLKERNEQDKVRIDELKAKRESVTTKAEKEKITREIERLKDREAYIHKDDPEIEMGLMLGDMMPELEKVSKTWNGIRRNARRVLVNSGLWTEEYADQMLDVIDYVPFYREIQLEENQGPREFIRGLQVAAKEHRFKGTDKPVNDVLDNMVRWTQYAVNRSIRNDKSVRMIDAALKIDMGDGTKMAERVTEAKRGMNIVRIWRNGEQELYNMADPLFADAFTGVQSVALEMYPLASKISNGLRDSVVLFPLFSVAQVPQDAFAAMFTSGLQPQYALRIPYLAVKEFIKTYRKSSATHELLKKFGAVGVRDFNSTVIRDDAEVFAGIKAPPGVKAKVKEKLQHIAMSADNAIRQAVYEASIQQGLSKAEALEKAFEVINFRRRGTSKAFQLAGQVVPFFYAYLAAQRVAYNTLTGVGISPQDRKAAWKTLMYTSAAVMTLSFLYSAAAADDEDYKNTPAAIRDRTLTIPGTGGLRIPLRTDFFLFPKIVAEHTYLLLTDKGYEDSAKFRRSMRDALGEALFSPTIVPQVIKPAVETVINYDFFTKRPILGTYMQKKEWERQFDDTTSEVSKLLGKTGYVSPIISDHLIRGFFGSVGGLFLWGTNEAIGRSGLIQSPPPEKSTRELLAALPGTSGFISRTNESALKNDFYQLRDEVEKAVNTFNDIKKYSPQGIKDYIEDEKRMAQLIVGKQVQQIDQKLGQLRARIRQINEVPATMMSASEKADAVRQLREIEQKVLEAVNVKGMREKAKI